MVNCVFLVLLPKTGYGMRTRRNADHVEAHNGRSCCIAFSTTARQVPQDVAGEVAQVGWLQTEGADTWTEMYIGCFGQLV